MPDPREAMAEAMCAAFPMLGPLKALELADAAAGALIPEDAVRDCGGVVFLPDDLGNARLLWMKGHRAMARRLLEDSRVKDDRARRAIEEHRNFTEAWIVEWEAEHA